MNPDNALNAIASDGPNYAIDVIKKPSRKKRKADSEVTCGTKGDHDSTQPKKKTKGKAKAGQLEGLMSLPMDVLFEVPLLSSIFPFCWLIDSRLDIWSFAPTRYHPFDAYHEG